ncbi:MAG TPA: hypothetical protein VHT75_20330 [Acidimicrobiales bacterium]|jgi:hypothetical protein|nr:hypothetical protein [Acidimicrobiales bacterium]
MGNGAGKTGVRRCEVCGRWIEDSDEAERDHREWDLGKAGERAHRAEEEARVAMAADAGGRRNLRTMRF